MAKPLPKNYDSALKEIQEIINDLETGLTNPEIIAEQTKRAMLLINFCKDKLHLIQQDVDSILSEK